MPFAFIQSSYNWYLLLYLSQEPVCFYTTRSVFLYTNFIILCITILLIDNYYGIYYSNIIIANHNNNNYYYETITTMSSLATSLYVVKGHYVCKQHTCISYATLRNHQTLWSGITWKWKQMTNFKVFTEPCNFPYSPISVPNFTINFDTLTGQIIFLLVSEK